MLSAVELQDVFLGQPITFRLTSKQGSTYQLSSGRTNTLDERLLKIPNGTIIRFHQSILLGTQLSNIVYGIGVIGHTTTTSYNVNAYGAEQQIVTTSVFIKVLHCNVDTDLSANDLVFDLETPYATNEGVTDYMYPNRYPTIFDIQNYFDGDDAEINNIVSYKLDNPNHTTPQVQQIIPFNSRSTLLSPQDKHKLDGVMNDVHLTNNGSYIFTFRPDQQRSMFFIRKSPDYQNTYHFVALEPSSCKFLIDFSIVIDNTSLSTRGITIHNNSINASNFCVVITEASLNGDDYDYYEVAIWNNDRDYAYQMSDVHLFTDDIDSVFAGFSNATLAEQSVTFGNTDYVSLEDELERCDTYGNTVRQVTQPYKTKEIPDNVDLTSLTDPGYYFKNRNVELIHSLPQEYDNSGFVIFVYPKKKDDDEWVRYHLFTTKGELYMGNSVVISKEIIYDDDRWVQFDEQETYNAGDVVWYGTTLYKFTRSHSGEWNINDVTSTTVIREIEDSHPTGRSVDDIFIVRNDENEVYAYTWDASLQNLESSYRVWTGDNSELTSTIYYRRELVWTVVTQSKNMTTIHENTDIAQLRVSGYYTGNGSTLKNCPTTGNFTMIVYPDGTNYLLVDQQNMAYTGVNVGTFEAPDIQWTNINNRYASSTSNIKDLSRDDRLEGGAGLYYFASKDGMTNIPTSRDFTPPFIYQVLPQGFNMSPMRMIYDSANHVYMGQLKSRTEQGSLFDEHTVYYRGDICYYNSKWWSFIQQHSGAWNVSHVKETTIDSRTSKFIDWEDISDTDYLSTELTHGTDLYTITQPGFYTSKLESKIIEQSQQGNETTTICEPPLSNIPDGLRFKMEHGTCHFNMLVFPVTASEISYQIIDQDGATYFGCRAAFDTSTNTGSIVWNDVQTNISATKLDRETDLTERLNPGYYYATRDSLPVYSPVEDKGYRLLSLAASQSSNNILFVIDEDGQAYFGNLYNNEIAWHTIPNSLMDKFNSFSSTVINYFNNTEIGKWHTSGDYINTLKDICTAPQLGALYTLLITTNALDQTKIDSWNTAASYIDTLDNTVSAANLAAFYTLFMTTNSVNQAKITKWSNAGDYIETLSATCTAAQLASIYTIISGITSAKITKWDTAGQFIDTLDNTCSATELASLYTTLHNISSNNISNWNTAYNYVNALTPTAQELSSLYTLLVTTKGVTGTTIDHWNAAYTYINALSPTATELSNFYTLFMVTKAVTGTKIDNWEAAYTFINGLTMRNSDLNTAYTNSHTHSNKTFLDTITDTKINNWDDAYTKRHTHSNSEALNSITTTKVSNWDTAYTNSHTHSNKTLLDNISNDTISHWNTAYTNNHTHGNKSIIDTITNAMISDWNNAASNASTALTKANQAVSTANSIAGTASSAMSRANEAYNIASEALNKQADKKSLKLDNEDQFIKEESGTLSLSIPDMSEMANVAPYKVNFDATGIQKVNLDFGKFDIDYLSGLRSAVYKFLILTSSGSATVSNLSDITFTGDGSENIITLISNGIQLDADKATEIIYTFVSNEDGKAYCFLECKLSGFSNL